MRTLAGVVGLLALVVALPQAGRGEDFKMEPGFKLLFNGKDLTGWQEATYRKQDPKTALDGKMASSTKRFHVEKGELVIDPAVKGDLVLFTADKLGPDAVIRFDFQPNDKCNNDLLWRGIKFDLRSGVKGLKVGEWNTFEIATTGMKATIKVNGEANKVSNAKSDSGVFGIRAEFGALRIKNLRAGKGS